MNKRSRIRRLDFSSDNRKSKIEKRPRRLKLVVLVTLIFAFVICGAVVEAQQPKKIHRIGWLEISSPNPEVLRLIGLFRKGLRDGGYVEGKSIVIEYRYAEGKTERLSQLAAELVHLKVDVIVARGGIPAIQSAKNATKTIPIVMGGGRGRSCQGRPN